MWDDLLTKTNAAYLVLTGIGAGIAKLYLNGRRELSELRTKLMKDRAGEQILTTETSLQIGWLQGLVKDKERDQKTISDQAKRIEDYGESRLNDARMLERKDAELVACRERVQEMKLERDLALEEMITTKKMLAAVQEHVNVVDGQLVTYRIANLRLFTALPPGIQQDMREHLLKQEPPKQ